MSRITQKVANEFSRNFWERYTFGQETTIKFWGDTDLDLGFFCFDTAKKIINYSEMNSRFGDHPMHAVHTSI